MGLSIAMVAIPKCLVYRGKSYSNVGADWNMNGLNDVPFSWE